MIAATTDLVRGQADGERRKLDAHATLEANRRVYVLRARRALLLVLLDQGTATADDIRDAVELPPDIGPKVFGAVPGPLAQAGIIHADGFVKTTRPVAHARPVTVWRLADRDAAMEWLRTHPPTETTNAAAATVAFSQPTLF